MEAITPIRLRLPALFASTALLTQFAPAQVPFSGGAYSQAFNTLASSGTPGWTDNMTLPGWYAEKAGSGTPSEFTAYSPNTGSGNTGTLYSYGPSGSSERALGCIVSSSSGSIAYGVCFNNDTAQTIRDIAVSYTGEQWRSGGTASQTLAFAYRIASSITDPDVQNANTWTPISALNFVAPVNTGSGALDGNSAPNRQVFTSVPLTGVTVPPGQEIFFRWYANKATSGGGHGFAVDDLTVFFSGPSVTNPPSISDAGQPQDRTNNAGTVAIFSVAPDGTPPFKYRWWKGAAPLSDGGNISGAMSATLTLSNVLAANAGSYFVGITNPAGGVTSTVAALAVNDPALLVQLPTTRTYFSGDTALLSVTAGGTAPLGYRWFKDGAPLSDGDRISGANASTLNVANLGSADAGAYRVIVTNGLGAASSGLATVSLIVVPSGHIAQWDFNNTNTPLSSPAPSRGNGTASLLNQISPSWATGSSLDTADTNMAWSTSDYPAATVSNKTAGVQFKVSTLGYTNILVAWEQRNSSTGSKYARLQYSSDGTNFADGGVIVGTGSFVYYSADLSSIPSVQSNPNFAFRIVAEFESTAINSANANYVPTSGTNYGTSGTLRFDMVSIFGESNGSLTPIPLQIQRVGNNIVLSWSNPAFGLQASPKLVSSAFTNVPGASSPYTNPIAAGPQFFRLKH